MLYFYRVSKVLILSTEQKPFKCTHVYLKTNFALGTLLTETSFYIFKRKSDDVGVRCAYKFDLC